MVVYELSAHMTTAKTTSRKSCWVATQSKTLYMSAPTAGQRPTVQTRHPAQGLINKPTQWAVTKPQT